MTEDNIKDIINDARDLAKVADTLTGFAIEGIANRLERLTAINGASSEGSAQSGFNKYLTVKWLGMEFRRFRSNAETVYVATWRNDATRESHVYEMHVNREGDCWIALATNDGRRVFSLSANGRSNCELCALSAMKRYLSRGHRGPYHKRMAEAANKEVA